MAKDRKKSLDETMQAMAAQRDKLKEGKTALAKKIRDEKSKFKAMREMATSGDPAVSAKIVKAKRSKFKCATTGKHFCDRCGKGIERGDTLRMVEVKYADKHADHFKFCSKDCRNAYCDENGIPQ